MLRERIVAIRQRLAEWAGSRGYRKPLRSKFYLRVDHKPGQHVYDP